MDEREVAIKVVIATLIAHARGVCVEADDSIHGGSFAAVGISTINGCPGSQGVRWGEIANAEALADRLFTGGAPQTCGERLAQIGLEVVGLLPRPS